MTKTKLNRDRDGIKGVYEEIETLRILGSHGNVSGKSLGPLPYEFTI